jgi:phosphohistidine phosphatase SixA
MDRLTACRQRLTSRRLLLSLLLGSAIPLPLLAAEAAPSTKGSPPAVADEAALASLTSVLPELRAGGYVIYFRHGVTDQSVADDSEPDFSRCDTQRNLTDEGRAQAEQIGKAIHDLAIPIGTVITSPYCRTKDTASLAFGHYQVERDLYFALNVDTAERDRLTHALSRMLATPPEAANNTVIIAHTANLRESTGFWPKPEGVAYVFKPMGMDQFVPVAKVLPDDWIKASAAMQ